MFAYITGGLGLVTAGSLIYASVIAGDNDALKKQVTNLEFELSACGGQLQTVLNDVRSDNEIDKLPDSALRDVPSHWLLTPTETDQ